MLITHGGLSCGDLVMRLRFHGVNDIRKLDRVLNEENRNIVPYNIPIAFFSVELGCKASNISYGVLS